MEPHDSGLRLGSSSPQSYPVALAVRDKVLALIPSGGERLTWPECLSLFMACACPWPPHLRPPGFGGLGSVSFQPKPQGSLVASPGSVLGAGAMPGDSGDAMVPDQAPWQVCAQPIGCQISKPGVKFLMLWDLIRPWDSLIQL